MQGSRLLYNHRGWRGFWPNILNEIWEPMGRCMLWNLPQPQGVTSKETGFVSDTEALIYCYFDRCDYSMEIQLDFVKMGLKASN